MIDEHTIREATQRLVEQFHPERIILFGSQARGTADDRSDVDLLVICDTIKDRNELALAMDRSLRGLKLPRDIVVMSTTEFEQEREIPGTVSRPASREGRVLYDRAA